MPSNKDIIDAFLAFCWTNGIQLKGPIRPDAGIQRCPIDGRKSGKLDGAYQLFTDGRPAGYAKDFVTGIEIKWKMHGGTVKPLTATEQAALEARKQQRLEQSEARQLEAKARAQKLYALGKPVTEHPYLTRKNVKPDEALRVIPVWMKRQLVDGFWTDIRIKNPLIVPLHNHMGEIVNAQAIFPEKCPILGRDKDFLPGGQLKGVFFRVGKPTTTILICEGLATGLTLHQSTLDQVYCAMSAGNLVAVAKIAKRQNPFSRLVIAAGNDEKTKGNPGLTAAKKAAREVGALVAAPTIPGDFNDLWTI